MVAKMAARSPHDQKVVGSVVTLLATLQGNRGISHSPDGGIVSSISLGL